ncbi:hypothetical protein [Halosimplex marinum]|uniref:hypothetical protein n=1 Tax=Halosimplex marinum TaxID=3396620 RepID=UPI003F568762
MSRPDAATWFLSSGRVNAALAWGFTALLALAAVQRLLSGRLVGAVVAATAVGLSTLPVALGRSRLRTVPWPVLALATLPFVVGSVEPTVYGLVVEGAGVAALGMLAVVALQLTTTVRTTPRFAVAFVFLVTLAATGVWTVLSAAAATYFGGEFVETNAELMRVFTAATVGGVLGGLVFRWYFRRQLREEGSVGTEEVTAE